MQFLIDTHVHIYPFYRVDRALQSLLENMARMDARAVRIACLTERHDCFLFDSIATHGQSDTNTVFDVERISPTVLRLTHRESERELYLVAGQQVVTSENIEILALNMVDRVDDGAPARDTVRSIRERNGVPVVAWAPGKWFGTRGKVVRELLNEFGPEEIALGDTSLRPLGWGVPYIMRAARRDGYRILAGSDPLPFTGEECRPGTYYSRMEHDSLDPPDIVGRLLDIAPEQIETGGIRLSPAIVARRLVSHKRAAKTARS